MISQKLEEILFTLVSGTVTEFFVWVTFIVLGLSLYEANKGKHSHFLEYAPTLMTSLGILGTFIGVVIGLLQFDTNNVDDSIPLLLEGLKTAFITSIVGMVCAMSFNFLDAWKFAPKRANQVGATKQNVTPDDIYAVLVAQKEVLVGVSKGLNGQEEGSLMGQVKLLRGDFADFVRDNREYNAIFSRKLWEELAHFADMLSKSATEQIIEALRQVIIDFNKNLTEQFGENFKALDASVKKLVDWQQAYKEQVEEMGDQFAQSVESLQDTRTAVAGIWEECKEIPLVMSELRDVLQVNQHQIAELQRHLEAFIHMRDAAVQAVPTIQQRVEEIGSLMLAGATGLQGTLDQTGLRMLENSSKMQVALEEGADHFRNSVTQTQQAFAAMSNDVATASEKLTDTLTDTVRDMNGAAKDVVDTMRTSVNDMAGQLQKHSSDLNTQFKISLQEFDRGHQQVLQQIAQTGSSAQQIVATNAERMSAELSKSFERAGTELDAHIKEGSRLFAADLSKKLENYETTTLRELSGELETLGKALTSITQRFVEDYRHLVSRMDEVIRLQAGRGS